MKTAVLINTVIALVLIGLGIYHLTHDGIPSGILEIFCATALLAAAYAASYPGTFIINLAIGILIFIAGVYHLNTGGEGSGVAQFIFTAMLLSAAYIFRKHGRS